MTRHIHLALAAILLLCGTLHGAPYTLRWNSNPPAEQVTEYGVYRIEQGAPVLVKKVPAGATATQQTPIEADPGQAFAIRAFSAAGESELSDPATVPLPKPSKPTGLQVVLIQTSDNLTDWKPIAYVTLHDGTPRRFVRASLTTITP